MATRVRTEVVDDITGELGAKTFSFSLGGVDYEIDLVSQDPLREALAPFMAAGRVAHRRKGQTIKADTDTTAVREWAKANGMTVSARGRISAEVREAYAARAR